MAKTDIYYIEVLGKALDILDVFAKAEKPRLSLQEISQETELNKNALRTRFRETGNLGGRHGGQVRYVDVRESPERFRLAERIGASDFLHSTALGKCHMAWMPFEEVKRLLKAQGMQRLTPATITTLAAMKEDLAATRSQGYALDREESMAGAFCVAVPILDGKCAPVAALSISGPTTRV